MHRHIPNHDDLIQALRRKRDRRDHLRTKAREAGRLRMTPEIARAIRDAKAADPDLTYDQLAERFGFSRGYIARVLRGTLMPTA